MKKLSTVVLAVALATMSSSAMAATISLTGILRDFNADGVDFEGVIAGTETGLLESTLPGSKVPVRSATASISGTASFSDWYNRPFSSTNTTAHSIVLDNTVTADPNVYTFSSSSFFPIDNMLLGNEGRTHNYHFTYQINSSFTYQGTETFSFTGDDDLWVFIDNKLAIDLGGVHGAASASVDLTTLGLTIGQDYDFDLYFAERHTTQSNFRIDTSIELAGTGTAIPEPATLGLFGLGLAGIGLAARRRKTA